MTSYCRLVEDTNVLNCIVRKLQHLYRRSLFVAALYCSTLMVSTWGKKTSIANFNLNLNFYNDVQKTGLKSPKQQPICTLWLSCPSGFILFKIRSWRGHVTVAWQENSFVFIRPCHQMSKTRSHRPNPPCVVDVIILTCWLFLVELFSSGVECGETPCSQPLALSLERVHDRVGWHLSLR